MPKRKKQSVVLIGAAIVAFALITAMQFHFLASREADVRSPHMPAEMPAEMQTDIQGAPRSDAVGQIATDQMAAGALSRHAPRRLSEAGLSPPTPEFSEQLSDTLHRAFKRFQEGDYQKALQLAQPVANADNPYALHLVGYIYERGLAGARDLKKARHYYQRAAEMGYVDAEVSLGLLLVATARAEADYALAVGWFKRAASKGDMRAIARLGTLYAEGLGVPRDDVLAMSLFEQAAAKGNSEGLFFVGMGALDGRGRPKDPKAAAQNLILAANAGHVEAAFNLALLYRSNLLGAPDKAEATRYMQSAAAAGYGPALTAMGLYAHNGDAQGNAADWFEKASVAGDIQGRLLFAVSLAKGDGRERNVDAARALAVDVANHPDASPEIAARADMLLRQLAGEALAKRAVGLRE